MFEQRLASGLLYGILISIIIIGVYMVIFLNYQKKKMTLLRDEISKVRKIIYDGPANYKKGINAIGGWLFLSEDAVEFYFHKINFNGQNIPILIDDIIDIETKANQLIIQTETETFKFVVSKPDLWKESITEIL